MDSACGAEIREAASCENPLAAKARCSEARREDAGTLAVDDKLLTPVDLADWEAEEVGLVDGLTVPTGPGSTAVVTKLTLSGLFDKMMSLSFEEPWSELVEVGTHTSTDGPNPSTVCPLQMLKSPALVTRTPDTCDCVWLQRGRSEETPTLETTH